MPLRHMPVGQCWCKGVMRDPNVFTEPWPSSISQSQPSGELDNLKTESFEDIYTEPQPTLHVTLEKNRKGSLVGLLYMRWQNKVAWPFQQVSKMSFLLSSWRNIWQGICVLQPENEGRAMQNKPQYRVNRSRLSLHEGGQALKLQNLVHGTLLSVTMVTNSKSQKTR